MRKFLFIFVTTLFICQSVPATSPPPDDWRIFQVREIPPSFPGGSAALVEWITKHLRYPVLAEEQGLEGHVLAAFWITADGSVKLVKIVRSGGELFDNEVLRVLRFMPRWVPGRCCTAPPRTGCRGPAPRAWCGRSRLCAAPSFCISFRV